ncbi:MAG: T9SS type A sorting domain-containing protein [Bacteroidales bacterium]|nr:T9SS type A sorting domain-containing protein [Bacteroidales bacterium]
MLISLNHSTAAMLNPPYSNYDYFKIPNPPGGSINGTYGIGAYPTVIIIKPNRAIAEQDIWPINNSILRSKILQHGGIPQDCNALTFELTLEVNPVEGGEVSGAGDYAAGAAVEINAVSNEGWMFENWTDELGTVVSTDATYSFTMPDNDLTLIANFQMMEFELVLLVNPEESGEVTGGGIYHLGDEVEISAIPYNGWGFLNWTNEQGVEVSSTAIFDFTMLAGDLTLTANFEPISGLDEVSQSGLLHVFPNPSTGMLKLNIDGKLVGSQYVMYNHLGENILSGQFHTENMVINMTDFPTGVYFITTTGSLKQSLKIIKK